MSMVTGPASVGPIAMVSDVITATIAVLTSTEGTNVTEYKKHDVLERTSDGRRIEVTKILEDDLYRIETLATGRSNQISGTTLRHHYANLTALDEGRYERKAAWQS